MKHLSLLFILILFFGCKELENPIVPLIEVHSFPKIVVYGSGFHVPNYDMSTASFRLSFINKSDLPCIVYSYSNDYNRKSFEPSYFYQETDTSCIYVMSVDYYVNHEETTSITIVCKFHWTTDSIMSTAYLFHRI
jgi:hypothetical protein